MLNVLVLCDDCWHPAETLVRAFAALDKGRYALDFVMAPRDILYDEMLYRYDVIVLARANSFSPALSSNKWFDPKWCAVMPENFRRYVESGRGYIALHAGLTMKTAEVPELAALHGSEFVFHPPQCPVTVRPVKDHPIAEGVKPFTARDEHYAIKMLCDDADVFLESASDSEAGVQVAGYTRQIGNGRLCALTPGHTLSALGDPNCLKLISNAIDWCAKQK